MGVEVPRQVGGLRSVVAARAEAEPRPAAAWAGGASGGGLGGGGSTGGGGGGGGGGTINPPAAPTLQSATPGNAQVTLRWTFVTGALGYDVFAGDSIGTLAIAQSISSGSTTSVTLTGLTDDQLTFFAVSARGQGGTSPQSNILSATPRAPALDVVSSAPDAGATAPRDTALELEFSAAVQTSSTALTLTPPAALTWAWAFGNTRLRLSPTGGTFAANTAYTLTLQSAQTSGGLRPRGALHPRASPTGALPLLVQETVPQVTAVLPADSTAPPGSRS